MKRVPLALTALFTLALLPVPAPADPPPWAPAHGWRKKNDPNYVGYTGRKWEKDYGVVEGHCNTQAIGAVLGGVVGGAVGSRAANEDNRPVALLVRGALAAQIRAHIRRSIGHADRP